MSQRPRPTASEILARAAALEASRGGEPSGQDGPPLLADLAAGVARLDELDDSTLDDLLAEHGVDAVVDAVLTSPLPSADAVAPPPRDVPTGLAGDGPSVLPFSSSRASRRVLSTRWLMVAAAAVFLVTTLAWGVLSRYQKTPDAQVARRGPDAMPKQGPADRGAETPAGKTVLVLVRGQDRDRVRQGEEVLLRTASDRFGFRPPPAAVVSSLRQDPGLVEAALRGDVATLAEVARKHGLDAIVVGDIAPRTALAPGRDNPVERVSLRLFRSDDSRSVVSRDIAVGRDFTSVLATATEAEIRAMAAREVMARTATAMRDWLERWNESRSGDPER